MRFLLLAAAAIVLTVESPIAPRRRSDAVEGAARHRRAAVLGHVKTLASDAFEGRAPGTPGEDKTVAYLVERSDAGPEAGQPRRHLRPGGTAGRHHAGRPRR